MADVTVAQFAEVLKVPVDRLLQQLDQAGIKVDSAEDMISEDAKHELLTHLRRSHGHDDAQADAAPRKITLRRKSQSELKLASPQGRARTVNVEVRSKRTYVKREVLEDQARHQQEEIDRQRETEEQAKAALERAEHERAGEGAARPRARSRRRAGAAAMKRTASAPPRKRRGARPKCRRASRPSASARRCRRGRQAGQGGARGGGRQVDPLRPPGAAHRRRCELAAQEEEVARRPAPLGGRRGRHQAWLRDADGARGARSGDRRGHDGRRARAEDGGQGDRSHQGHDEHGRHGHDQSNDRAGYGRAGGRGDGPHRGAAQGKRHRGRSAGRDRFHARGVAAAAGRDRDGPRRSRQDLAARLHPAHQGGRGRSRRHHAAHRRVPRRDLEGHGHLSRYAGPCGLHLDARARRAGDRHRDPGGRRRRRRHAADHRSDPARAGGQGADRGGAQQDGQARGGSGEGQAGAHQVRRDSRGVGRREHLRAGLGAHRPRRRSAARQRSCCRPKCWS